MTVEWILPDYERRCLSAASSPCCPLYSLLSQSSSVAVVRLTSDQPDDVMSSRRPCRCLRSAHTRRRVPTLGAGKSLTVFFSADAQASWWPFCPEPLQDSPENISDSLYIIHICHDIFMWKYRDIQSESKNPPWDILTFSSNDWEFLVQILHAYYTFLSIRSTANFYSIICNFDKVMPY